MDRLFYLFILVKINYMASFERIMAGWLKAEFSTCRIALKADIFKFHKSQKGEHFFVCVLSASAQIRVTADNFTRGDVTLKARKKTKCHELWHLVFQHCMCSSLEEHFDEVGVVVKRTG